MNSLELFSGAGGMAKGLELAGFNHAAFVEFNRHACESLCANFEPSKVYCGDIRGYDFAQLSGVDVVAGGPPCQPFSMAGKHKAHDDSRDMFPYAINAIDVLRPRAFIFENVKGLLRPNFREYFDYILLRLALPDLRVEESESWKSHLNRLRKQATLAPESVKYRVAHKLLNAADYGVPQVRERVFIVGIRSDIQAKWQFPSPTHSADELLIAKWGSGEYWQRHRVSPVSSELESENSIRNAVQLDEQSDFFATRLLPWRTVRDALAGVCDPQAQHNILGHDYRAGARVYPGHTGSELDLPAKTIKAGGHGVPGGENMMRFPDGTVRYFTTFEAKRIQTFPDDFVVTGAWGEAMRQLGNAVPVALAQRLGEALSVCLSRCQNAGFTVHLTDYTNQPHAITS
jgi:DNA (cytosine-5)-methyltransferase 1